MGYSPSERSTPLPPIGRSPERMAWSAALMPWLTVWLRFMRCAQAGGPGGLGLARSRRAASSRHGPATGREAFA